jgi:SpoVK/Ycf46/Vps4 family AAA+-type ATPase
MIDTIDLVLSPKSKKNPPNNPSKLLTLIWALRISQFNEYDSDITDIKIVNDDWFNLVSDYIEWPVDLLIEIYDVTCDIKKESKQSNATFESFVKAFNHQPKEINIRLQTAVYELEQHWLQIRNQDYVWHNIKLLSDLFNLGDVERDLILFTFYYSGNRDIRKLFREMDSIPIHRTSEFFAIILNSTIEQFNNAMHKKGALIANRLITHQQYHGEWFSSLSLDETIGIALTFANKDIDDMMSHFIDQSAPSNLTLEDIPHLRDSFKMLSNVMRNALHQEEKGINILIYGPPGTGKTEFAKLLAQHINTTLYEVSAKDCDGESANGRERYLSLVLAQNYLTGKEDTLLLFDEVEDVLTGSGSANMTSQFGSNRLATTFSKAWVNQQLENNPVPTIWICNDHEFIDPAHLRRFIFHIEIKIPPRSVREKIAERYFNSFNLPKGALTNLSNQTLLSPAQLENTARLLKLHNSDNPQETEILLNNVVANSMSVMGQAFNINSSKNITPYSLDYLNIDSHVTMERILDGIKKRPQANLCFYGPPGTGKTQLAVYIAEQLDKQLIIKRASDLISPWLGQSEQNIAAMFKEAKNEKAILFLDEADSFLRSRQGMAKNWEVSQVNELLQQMECFEGIFICATNLFDQFDEAALRRFVFKIRFDSLKPIQRLKLFAISLGDENSIISHAHEQRLLKLEQLTPGDFATVLRQANALGETFTASELLAQLEQECVLKKGNHSLNKIGFI